MIVRSHVTDPADVSRQRLSSPSFAAQSKLEFRRKFCSADKKFFYSPLAVRQAISHKQKITGRICGCRDQMMGSWVKSVVNGIAIGCAHLAVMLHDRWAASISKNKVILRNQSAKLVLRIFFHSRQRRRRIYIPKSDFG